MPKLAFIRLYFDDIEAETALLPDNQIDDLRWKYLRLLVKGAYEHGNAIPSNDRTIARLAGIERTKNWRKKVAFLRGFFHEENGFLIQKRTGIELDKIAETNVVALSERKVAAGGGIREGRVRTTSTRIQNPEYEYGRQAVDNFGDWITEEMIEEARRRYPGRDIDDATYRCRVYSAKQGVRVEKPRRAYFRWLEKDAQGWGEG